MVFEEFFQALLTTIVLLLGKAIAFLASLVTSLMSIRVWYEGMPVVRAAWEVMRDFANLFLIIIMVIMAFGTIFNTATGGAAGQYSIRTMLPRLLFISILVNFSLPLAGLVIDFTQVINNTFLNAIGNFGTNLLQGLQVDRVFPPPTSGIAPNLAAQVGEFFLQFIKKSETSFLYVITVIIMFFSIAASLLMMAVFLILRVPIIWFMLIISPVAWVSGIWPGTKKNFENWWSRFIGWNLFLPILLFYIYFAFYLLGRQQEIVTAIAANGQTFFQNPILDELTIKFQTLFYYAVTTIVLFWGTGQAYKYANSIGTKSFQLGGFLQNVVWRAPGLNEIDAARVALDKKIERIKKEGMNGKLRRFYGGEAGQLDRVKRWQARLGTGDKAGALALEKDYVSKVKKEFDELSEQYDLGKISAEEIVKKAKGGSPTNAANYAHRRLAAKLGVLDKELLTSTMSGLKGNRFALKDFTELAKGSKFASVDAGPLLKMATARDEYSNLASPEFTPARREMFRHVVSDNAAIARMKEADLEVGIDVMGGKTTAEAKELIKTVGKIRPDIEESYKIANDREPLTKAFKRARHPSVDAETDTTITPTDAELRSFIYEKSLGDVKDIAAMPLKEVWHKSEFGQALITRITQLNTVNPRSAQNFVNRLAENIRTAPNAQQKNDMLAWAKGIALGTLPATTPPPIP